MFRIAPFILLISCLTASNAFAQNSNPDSLRRIAVEDAKNFKLSEENLKRFKINRSSSSSDLFKPTSLNTSNASLLSDSVYVNAFRKSAHKNIRKANAVGHHKKIGVLGYAAAIVFVGLVFLGFNQI
ncbi:hypothetical protein [Pedobacter aquatilis]|uniref:hypothetical protein n=1 Tax=Pedobacter aquatilis TaxID=351343 RepID=UPI002930708D|nr:hypothetical protein [Pedobacter aquatilis]